MPARIADFELLPGYGTDAARPVAKGPRFALVAAADGFQYALDHAGPRTLTICSSVDAAELEDRIARPGRPRADRKPSKCVVSFPIYGLGISDMKALSAAQINLRQDLASRRDVRDSKRARLRALIWLWPPSITDRKLAGAARRTMEAHPGAKHALLVVPPALAAAWQSRDWPVEYVA